MRVLILFLLLAVSLYPQEELGLDFDYAQFRYDSTSNYLEIYYAIDQNSLIKKSENGETMVSALMHIQIENSESGELVVNKDWKLKQPIIKNGNSSKSLLGVLGFALKSGFYSVTISVSDDYDQDKNKSYTENISVYPYYREQFSISDIELASRIINDNSNTNSIFYKNTMEIFPNPSILFSNLNPILFYYSEMYGLNNQPGSEKLEVSVKLLNSFNETVYEKNKMINRTQESMVEVGYVNLQKYPTDTYNLILSVTDSLTKKMFASSKKFFHLNPDIVASKEGSTASSGFLNSEFVVLSEEECDDIFNQSKIAASDVEEDEYAKLDSVDHKREFLYKFWLKRDNIPATQLNEFKKEYFDRISAANSRFRTVSSPGYRTDRGNVYIKLGEPDEIDRHPYETETKPYEVWYYNQIEGGVMFVFADLTGFNNYELLHSTKRGELQDPYWQRKIQTN
jgi:GWxTD domain-containing protein